MRDRRTFDAKLVLLVPLALAGSAIGCIYRPGDGRTPSGGAASPAAGAAAVPGYNQAGAAGFPAPPGSGVARPSGPPGNVTVLDWAGFRAAVTYTFDDANSSQIQHYDELQALGVRMTFYLITGKTPEFDDPVWARALRDGHEIGSHSKSHRHTGTQADMDASDQAIRQKLGVDVWTMAAPYGDGSYISLATSRYLINRGVADGLIGPGDETDPFNLFCYIPPSGAKASAFDAEVDAARAAGKWRTVLVHGFTGGTDGAYQPVAIAEFIASVNHSKSLGDVWIDTMANVGAYWRAQKMFAAIMPTTSGHSKTWTWTLPPHFPPGKVLRVKVDGGTLTQPGGRTLAWDDHGYYEVALDAGSLTLAP
jgi:peptidoglycan/xylan/chitin deacetylase (PgdA/CDA1 family)